MHIFVGNKEDKKKKKKYGTNFILNSILVNILVLIGECIIHKNSGIVLFAKCITRFTEQFHYINHVFSLHRFGVLEKCCTK